MPYVAPDTHRKSRARRGPLATKRLEIGAHQVDQVLGPTDETVAQPQGPLAPVSRVPVRRIELRIGKLTLPDVYDINDIGSDSHVQFMNWIVDNNGA